MSSPKNRPSAADLEAYIHASFGNPASEPALRVESVGEKETALRWRITERELRPGASVSGPTMMAMADTAAWVLVMHNLGLDAAPSVTSSMNIHFLSRPAPVDLLATGKLLKLGRRLSVTEVSMFSEGSDRVVAHATVSYAVVSKPGGEGDRD